MFLFITLIVISIIAIIVFGGSYAGISIYELFFNENHSLPPKPVGDLVVIKGQYPTENNISETSNSALYPISSSENYCLTELWAKYEYLVVNGDDKESTSKILDPLLVWDPTNKASRIGFRFQIPKQSGILQTDPSKFKYRLYVSFSGSKTGTYSDRKEIRTVDAKKTFGNVLNTLDDVKLNTIDLPSFCSL